MSLETGTRLGRYEILAPLGEGGMGEVYRAHDERLDRDVAIKVLPEAVAQDEARLARFEREAKLLASLSHQNIATLHSFESAEPSPPVIPSEAGSSPPVILRSEATKNLGGGALSDSSSPRPDPSTPASLRDASAQDDSPGADVRAETHRLVHFLVMELAEGETLAERIKKGPIPVDDALPIALQIAEGLEAAHEQGIIHRDLKPANVMLSPEGKVKILDFGLAKAWAPEESDAVLTDSPTLTAQMTAAGVLLGTAAYMSPEQARGKAVDKRADIWAFGCVVWEMLTCERLFSGDTVSDVLAAVLRQEPEWAAVPAPVPAEVRRLLLKCLEKNPRQRLHEIADARIEIEALLAPGDRLGLPVATTERIPAWRRVLPWGVAAVAVLVAVGLQLRDKTARSELDPRPVRRAAIILPESEPVALAESAPLGVGRPSIALSPDGTTLVYVAAADGKTHLALRLMAEFDTRQLPGTEGAFHPFFSPDGQWVGFFTETELKKLAIAGGQVVTLCEARNPVGGSWGQDGRIYFAPDWGDRVLRVSAEGGAPEPVAAEGIWPRLLPDGRSLLVTLGHTLSPSVAVLPLDGGEPDVVIERGGDARYLPTGHLAFVRTGQLLAAPFDLERTKVTGPAVPLINGVRTDLRDGGQVAISGDGTVVYVPGPPSTEISPAWTDHQGFTESLGLPTDVYGGPMLSPDGNRLAVLVAGLNTDIWIYDVIRRNPLRLTSDGQNYSPVWTPDGLWVIYRRIGLGIFRRRANGTGDEERLTSTDGIPFSVTPDGENLLFTLKGKAWSLPLRSENRTETSVETATRISGLNRLSPGGRWMAMTSGESGRSEVYVEPYPPSGERWMISSGGGEEPVWSPRADKIYYRYGNTWMAADVTSQPRFSAGTPTFMFEGDFANSPGYSYDIHPDGRRFLVMKRGEGPPPTTLHVIHNWFEELKRLVPTE